MAGGRLGSCCLVWVLWGGGDKNVLMLVVVSHNPVNTLKNSELYPLNGYTEYELSQAV